MEEIELYLTPHNKIFIKLNDINVEFLKNYVYPSIEEIEINKINIENNDFIEKGYLDKIKITVAEIIAEHIGLFLENFFKLSKEEAKKKFDILPKNLKLLFSKKETSNFKFYFECPRIEIEYIQEKLKKIIFDSQDHIIKDFIEKYSKNTNLSAKQFFELNLPYLIFLEKSYKLTYKFSKILSLFKLDVKKSLRILDTNTIHNNVISKKILPAYDGVIYICPLEIVIEFFLRNMPLGDYKFIDYILDNDKIIVLSSRLKEHNKDFLSKFYDVLYMSKNDKLNRINTITKFLLNYKKELKNERSTILTSIRKKIFFMFNECFWECLLWTASNNKYEGIQQQIKDMNLKYDLCNIHNEMVCSEEKLFETMTDYKIRFITFFENIKRLKNKKIFNKDNLDNFFPSFFDRYINQMDLNNKDKEHATKIYYGIFCWLKDSFSVSRESILNKIDDNTIYDLIISSYTPFYDLKYDNRHYGNCTKVLEFLNTYDSIQVVTNDDRMKKYIVDYNRFVIDEFLYQSDSLLDKFNYTPTFVLDLK